MEVVDTAVSFTETVVALALFSPLPRRSRMSDKKPIDAVPTATMLAIVLTILLLNRREIARNIDLRCSYVLVVQL